jgi:hypothetical protein
MMHNFMAKGASAADAQLRAPQQFSAQVDLQASVLAFKNYFYVLGLLVLFLVPLPFLLRRPSKKEAEAAAAARKRYR